LNTYFNISSHLCLCFQGDLLYSGFPTKTAYAFLFKKQLYPFSW
jgi:hypothetical protein